MLNWLARYAPAGAMLLEGGRATGSILDVGCGPHGLACAHPGVRFVGLDVTFPHAVAPSMVGIEAPAGPLPFVDGAFDTVLSLDTLEHVPRPDRAGFVAELARVSARRVLLACPTDEGAPLDALVRERFTAGGMPVPEWLAEHQDLVLPARAELQEYVDAVPGFRARVWPMVNGLLAALLPWADLFEFSPMARAEAADRRAEWVQLLERADFGPSFRGAWVLERVEARTPVVGPEVPEDDVAAALRCLACGAPHAWAGDAPVCTACGRAPERAPSRAWKLVATAPAVPAPAAAAQALLLRPVWDRPRTWLAPLAAYIAAADPHADVTLFVEAGDEIELDVVGELMGVACRHLAGDVPFGDVAVVAPGDTAPVGATLVEDAAAVRAALGAVAEDRGEDVAGRARWGKVLADGLRAMVDQRRYELAPAAWDDPDPLVTVLVPARDGADRLERALAAVLGGAHRNVEVLVCADGADPAVRAVVEQVDDARVELVEPPAVHAAPRIAALNAALDRARGAWIAPLTADAVVTYDQLAFLIAAARWERLDVAHGDVLCTVPGGPPVVLGDGETLHGGAVLYSARLGHLRYDAHGWLDGETADAGLWRRLRETGASVSRVPRVVVVREGHAEAGWDVAPDADSLAREVRATDASWYLDVAPIRVPVGA